MVLLPETKNTQKTIPHSYMERSYNQIYAMKEAYWSRYGVKMKKGTSNAGCCTET